MIQQCQATIALLAALAGRMLFFNSSPAAAAGPSAGAAAGAKACVVCSPTASLPGSSLPQPSLPLPSTLIAPQAEFKSGVVTCILDKRSPI
jgi:hypothetical protein